jgi:hypothetical protein
MSQSQWKDTMSLMEMMPNQGFTSEPFVKWKSDLRIQKIGDHYRAIRRFKTRPDNAEVWKANEGFGIEEEDVKVEERWKQWADVCARELKMDILGIDLLVDEEGNEFLLEVNSSSVGFAVRHRAEDVGHIVELLLQAVAATSDAIDLKRKRRLLKQEVQIELSKIKKERTARLDESLWSSLISSIEQRKFSMLLKCKLNDDNASILLLYIYLQCLQTNGDKAREHIVLMACHKLVHLYNFTKYDKYTVENAVQLAQELSVLS